MLAAHLARTLPADALAAVTIELAELGGLGGGHFHRLQLADRLNEPVHTPWDPWGRRIDHIELTPLWKEAAVLAARRGLVAAGYEPRLGAHARTHQFAMIHVIGPSLDVYSCPLAM